MARFSLPSRPRVVVTRKLMPETEQRMSELFDVRLNTADRPLTRDELCEAVATAHVLVPTITDALDAELIGRAGADLGLIANFGVGTNHIDLAAARERRIAVTNTPGVLTDDTADLAMGLIVMAARRFANGMAVVREGTWAGWTPSTLLGHRIAGRRLAILGMGRIGQAVAHRARAFGLEIVYHNRHRLPASLENMLGARYEPDLGRLIAGADILSLHCPFSAETRHVLSAERIAAMKPGAIVVNTARGELIDEAALAEALVDGRLAAAGLDVFENEPALDPRLAAAPNLVVLPHLGSATYEGRSAMGDRVIANIQSWVDGHRPPDQVLEGLV